MTSWKIPGFRGGVLTLQLHGTKGQLVNSVRIHRNESVIFNFSQHPTQQPFLCVPCPGNLDWK